MNPETRYDPQITPEFIMACAKIAKVEVLSHQVCLTAKGCLNLKQLEIPVIYGIERASIVGDSMMITLYLKNHR